MGTKEHGTTPLTALFLKMGESNNNTKTIKNANIYWMKIY